MSYLSPHFHELPVTTFPRDRLRNPKGSKHRRDDGDYRVGDVVTYTNQQGLYVHFARVTRVDSNGKITKVTSKWGKGRLMKHGLTNVPAAYGSPHQVCRKK